MKYDVIIIGGGPGGLSAALYLSRAGLKTLLLEAAGLGGQVNFTYDIDNYLGFTGTGPELTEKMHAQAEKFGTEISYEKALEIKNANETYKKVVTRRNEYSSRFIIISAGAKPRLLGVDGEDRLKGMGVSYCATCDGAFFKDKTAAVVGGGNTAFEDALYLANFCNSVHLIHRSENFRANAHLIEKVRSNPKIAIHTNETVEKIQGDTAVKSLVIKHTLSSRIGVLDTDAVFVAIGRAPETSAFSSLLELDKSGYIKTDNNMRTNVDGIYAVGDVRTTPLRQIVTAASDGAIAANDIVNRI